MREYQDNLPLISAVERTLGMTMLPLPPGQSWNDYISNLYYTIELPEGALNDVEKFEILPGFVSAITEHDSAYLIVQKDKWPNMEDLLDTIDKLHYLGEL
jgi:hypothetical protein